MFLFTKKYRLSFVLIVLLISITILGCFSVKGLSAETLDFTFEKDIFYDVDNPPIGDSYNVKNQSEYSGDYEGIYSFEDKLEIYDFVLEEEGGNINIINNYDGHNSVLFLNDSDNNNIVRATQTFGNVSIGTIEQWVNYDSDYLYIECKSYFSTRIWWVLFSEALPYFEGGNYTGTAGSIILNKWFHYRVDWNKDLNLIEHYINGINILDTNFTTNYIPYKIQIYTHVVKLTEIYIDAIGYYWYDATYSFTDDADNTVPVNWSDDSTGDCNATVYPSFEGRNKVLRLYDHQAGFHATAKTNISTNIENGTIGFWIARDGPDAHGNPMLTYSNTTVAMNVLATGGVFNLYYDGSVHSSGVSFLEDQWYHIELDFDCSDDSLNLIIDDNLELEGQFQNVVSYINKVSIDTDNTKDNYVYMIDDVRYSWDFDDYNIGDNIIPILDVNEGVYVPDRYEFYYEGEFDPFETGDDNPNGWLDVETDGDDVNCLYASLVKILVDNGETNGLKKNDTSIEYIGMLDLTFGFKVKHMAPTLTTRIDMLVYSYDFTEIVQVYLDEEGEIGYHDGSNYIVLDDGLTLEAVDYDIRIYIDYEIDLCVMEYYADNIFVNRFMFPLQTLEKEGLGEIKFTGVSNLDGLEIWLDYIGVYVNGSSITTEFATVGIDITDGDKNIWYFNTHNLVWFDVIGNNVLTYLDSNASIGAPGFSPETLLSSRDFNGSNLINFYGYTYDSYWLYTYTNVAFFSFLFYNQFEINNINIEGVLLTENGNDYPLEYSYGNILTNESYFYVDSNNRLRYSLVANDNDNEFIQAIFDINDLSSENRSIRFNSDINGNAYGFFAVNYYDSTDSVLDFPYYSTTTVVILPQTQVIDEFLILITDNDLTDNTVCTGFVSNIRLIYYPDLQVIITTLNLLAIIVPLIIMIVPPIALHKKFGITGVFVMFIFMAIICVATSLIPVWLFFIIALSSVGLIAMKKEIGDKK